MKTVHFSKGQTVHADTDNREWGRIASDVEVICEYHTNVLCYVPFHISANILIPKKDITNSLASSH